MVRHVFLVFLLLPSGVTAQESPSKVCAGANAGRQHAGGTQEPVDILNCLGALTRRRIRELYDHYLRGTNTRVPQPNQ